jgi:hypothetical protein
VLALELAVNLGPTGLGVTAAPLLGADRGEELRLQRDSAIISIADPLPTFL